MTNSNLVSVKFDEKGKYSLPQATILDAIQDDEQNFMIKDARLKGDIRVTGAAVLQQGGKLQVREVKILHGKAVDPEDKMVTIIFEGSNVLKAKPAFRQMLPGCKGLYSLRPSDALEIQVRGDRGKRTLFVCLDPQFMDRGNHIAVRIYSEKKFHEFAKRVGRDDLVETANGNDVKVVKPAVKATKGESDVTVVKPAVKVSKNGAKAKRKARVVASEEKFKGLQSFSPKAPKVPSKTPAMHKLKKMHKAATQDQLKQLQEALNSH